MRAGIIISLMIWIGVYLSACSFHVGVDWNGETAKDNRTYTQKKGG